MYGEVIGSLSMTGITSSLEYEMHRILEVLPFLAIIKAEGGRPKLNIARILELIIALAGMYYTMSLQMAKIEAKMNIIERQVYIIDARLYEHNANSRQRAIKEMPKLKDYDFDREE